MRLALLSDTHQQHDRIDVGAADIVIHAGDFTKRGSKEECLRFLDWYAGRAARHKLLVAGNHDFWAESDPEAFREACRVRDIRWLQQQLVEVDGLRIWGSAFTPWFHGMAFNRRSGSDIASAWAEVPGELDVLVTHGPPKGVLDHTFLGIRVGCESLMTVIRQRPPRLHVFGHIHESRGETQIPGVTTRFVNASNARLGYLGAPRNATIVEI